MSEIKKFIERFGVGEVFWNYLPQSVIEKNISNPEFNKTTRVHDWRNHVPEFVEIYWYSFSLETKLVVYFMAQNAALDEDWD